MTDSIQFQGGTFDPVEQVDVLPEQEKLMPKQKDQKVNILNHLDKTTEIE